MLEENFDSEILESLRKTSPLSDLKLFNQKCEDLKKEKDSKEFREFIEQAKRISRITEGIDKKLLDRSLTESILKTDEEKNLLRGSFEIKTYDLKSVKDLYKLTPLINSFFEAVLVNDENIEDKNNRLALLLKLRSSFDTFADFTKFKKV